MVMDVPVYDLPHVAAPCLAEADLSNTPDPLRILLSTSPRRPTHALLVCDA